MSSLRKEIYEKVNCSTSDDWNEGHPFKDRNNISLFVSYAEKRRCGFRAGRITIVYCTRSSEKISKLNKELFTTKVSQNCKKNSGPGSCFQKNIFLQS